jgi:hypothetical protein
MKQVSSYLLARWMALVVARLLVVIGILPGDWCLPAGSSRQAPDSGRLLCSRRCGIDAQHGAPAEFVQLDGDALAGQGADGLGAGGGFQGVLVGFGAEQVALRMHGAVLVAEVQYRLPFDLAGLGLHFFILQVVDHHSDAAHVPGEQVAGLQEAGGEEIVQGLAVVKGAGAGLGLGGHRNSPGRL